MARLICILMTLFVGVTMATEEPAYSLIKRSGEFELRRYSPMIVAETIVDGSMGKAGNSGFRAIADYIFGNNTNASGDPEKISMTAPVSMAAASETTHLQSLQSLRSDQSRWRVHFVMPSAYHMDTLPKPNTEQVTLRAIPATDVAVIRFSGLTGEQRVADKTKSLLAWMDAQGITAQSEPELARYDPPWTLPFLRRNEIWITYTP